MQNSEDTVEIVALDENQRILQIMIIYDHNNKIREHTTFSNKSSI